MSSLDATTGLMNSNIIIITLTQKKGEDETLYVACSFSIVSFSAAKAFTDDMRTGLVASMKETTLSRQVSTMAYSTSKTLGLRPSTSYITRVGTSATTPLTRAMVAITTAAAIP